MNGLITILETIPRYFGRIAGWLTVALVVVIGYDVGTRRLPIIHEFVSNSFLYDYISPTKLQELEWHLLAAIFLFSLGFAYLENSHIRVDIIRESMSLRRKAKLEIIGILVLAFPYFGTMLWFSWDYVHTAFLHNEGSPSLTGIPNRWIIKSSLLIGFSCLILAMLANLFRLASVLFQPTKKNIKPDKKYNKPTKKPNSQQQVFHLQ